VKRREEARETLDDALARVAAAMDWVLRQGFSCTATAQGCGIGGRHGVGVEEAAAFAAYGRGREERPTGPAVEVKQREEARETLDEALARVAAAAAPPRPRAVESARRVMAATDASAGALTRDEAPAHVKQRSTPPQLSRRTYPLRSMRLRLSSFS
jgi:hypothetical protein